MLRRSHAPRGTGIGRSRPIVRRGAAAVELAIVAPFLVTLVLGTCEVGQMLRVHAILTEATRVGCGAASLPGSTNDEVIRDVQNALTNSGLPADSATVTIRVNDVTGDLSAARRNDKISVSVSIPTAEAAWTGSFTFFSRNSLQSETTVMLKQG